MATRELSSDTAEPGIGEPVDEPTNEHRKMCYVCNRQITVGREKWERGEPVHGECKLGWMI